VAKQIPCSTQDGGWNFILFYFFGWQNKKKNCLAIAKEKKSRGKKKKNCPCISKDKEVGKHPCFVKRKE
jgi:hypothetical protein